MSRLTACLPLTLKYSSILNRIPSRLAVVIMSCVYFPAWCVCLNHIWNEWLKVSLSVITRNAKPIDCVRVAINKFKSQCAHFVICWWWAVPVLSRLLSPKQIKWWLRGKENWERWCQMKEITGNTKGSLCRHLCMNSCLHSLEAGSNALSADYLT